MNRRAMEYQLIWGHKTPQVEAKFGDIIPWVYQSGRPYYDVFLEGADHEEILRRWMQRSSSEIALRRTRLLLDDQRIVGGYISHSGRELAGCRQADLLDLARSLGDISYQSLRRRMEDLKELFAPVEENDFYLSRHGLLPGKECPRRRQALLQDCLRRARQGGFGRLRVDVAEENREARDFYQGQGFLVAYRGKSEHSRLRYLSMIFLL